MSILFMFMLDSLTSQSLTNIKGRGSGGKLFSFQSWSLLACKLAHISEPLLLGFIFNYEIEHIVKSTFWNHQED